MCYNMCYKCKIVSIITEENCIISLIFAEYIEHCASCTHSIIIMVQRHTYNMGSLLACSIIIYKSRDDCNLL